jgi:hypothetical protein
VKTTTMTRKLGVRTVFVAVAAFAAICATAGPAAAKSTVFSFTNTPSTAQAGAHPTVVTTFELGNRNNQTPVPCECNDPKSVMIHTPAGVVANPHVASECTAAELATFSCSADAQVGLAEFKLFGWHLVPIYRTVPQAGQASLFVFVIPLTVAIPQYISVNARTGGDYGLDFKVLGFSQTSPVEFFANVFWGVPGEAANDILRFAPGERAISCSSNPLMSVVERVLPEDCVAEGAELSVFEKEPVSSSLPVAPFTQNPTTCVGPLKSTIDVLAYDGEETHGEAPWPATTGCDKLSFAPSLAAAPTTTETDSASGLAVDLTVPQFEDPETPSPSELRATRVTLPPGFSINPNAADGKSACSDAQANFTNEEAATCPEHSKVGTTVLESSALPGPIDGYIYLGEPEPGDRYRVFLTASGYGTNVKIAGSVRPDPQSGQITAAFEDLPQAPFQRFDLHFFGSERGLLATPTQCGTYPVSASFEPWARQLSDQTSTQFFKLDSGPAGGPCPGGARPFGPAFAAGAEDGTAGQHSAFAVQLTRQDGDQGLAGLTVKTPPGFSASLAGVPYCPDSAIAQIASRTGLAEQSSPACPQASRIGTVTAGAGAGTHPLYVGGSAYLAGPYEGAPLSMVVVVPAISGPYDLGNVAVRVALQVDPESARITAISDPLPQILEGIPLRTRFVRVDLDRPGFALNPTNCDPFAVAGTIAGAEGATSEQSAPFQVANCADLPHAPKLSLRLSGGLARRGHPAIHARFAARAGEANTKLVSVALPKGEQLDNAHLESVCSRVQFAAQSCPALSRIGTAKAITPLLEAPLRGPVYLRTAPENKSGLPDVVADLHGQIHVILDGKIKTVHSRLRTTFGSVPDVPVASFSLDLAGGKKGLLQNESSLCAKRRSAAVRMVGQNGKRSHFALRLRMRCAKAHRRARRHHRRGSR